MPEMVESADIMEFDLDSNPVDRRGLLVGESEEEAPDQREPLIRPQGCDRGEELRIDPVEDKTAARTARARRLSTPETAGWNGCARPPRPTGRGREGDPG